MSIENQIAELTAAVKELTAAVSAKSNVPSVAPVPVVCAPVTQPVYVQPAPVAPPIVAHPAPVPLPVVAPVYVAPAAPVAQPMPSPPSFIPPAPVAPVNPGYKAPFTDAKGLIDYVMGAYRALGPERGAKIQNVLVGLGYQNINDVLPGHYDALFAGIEQIK